MCNKDLYKKKFYTNVIINKNEDYLYMNWA